MWESLLTSPWTALAIVPADHDTPVGLVTRALSAVASRQPKGALRLIDAQGATVPAGELLARELEVTRKEGSRVAVVIDSVMRSLSGIPLVRQADAVVLVVRVGSFDPNGLASTIGILGQDRILGSIAVPPEA